jgi:hypothetical protein
MTRKIMTDEDFRSAQEIEDYIVSLGFEIIRPVIHGGPGGVVEDDHIDYGVWPSRGSFDPNRKQCA